MSDELLNWLANDDGHSSWLSDHDWVASEGIGGVDGITTTMGPLSNEAESSLASPLMAHAGIGNSDRSDMDKEVQHLSSDFFHGILFDDQKISHPFDPAFLSPSPLSPPLDPSFSGLTSLDVDETFLACRVQISLADEASSLSRPCISPDGVFAVVAGGNPGKIFILKEVHGIDLRCINVVDLKLLAGFKMEEVDITPSVTLIEWVEANSERKTLVAAVGCVLTLFFFSSDCQAFQGTLSLPSKMHRSYLRDMKVHNNLLVSGDYDGKCLLTDIETVIDWQRVTGTFINNVTFTQVCQDVRQNRKRSHLVMVDCRDSVSSINWKGNSNCVSITTDAGSILLWDTRSTNVESFHTDAGPLYAHTFYDEHMLLTGGEDGVLRCYDIRRSSKPYMQVQDAQDKIGEICAYPGGVITAGAPSFTQWKVTDASLSVTGKGMASERSSTASVTICGNTAGVTTGGDIRVYTVSAA